MFPLRRTSSDKIMLFSSQPLRDVKGGPHCPPAISACNWAASAGRAPSLGVTTAKSPQPRQSYAKIRAVRRRRLRCAGKPVTGKIRPAARTPENLGPPSETAAVFGKLGGRHQGLGSRLCPVGHVVCAAPRGGAVTGRQKDGRGLGWVGKLRSVLQSGSQAAMSNRRPRAHRAVPSLP